MYHSARMGEHLSLYFMKYPKYRKGFQTNFENFFMPIGHVTICREWFNTSLICRSREAGITHSVQLLD